MAKQRTVMHRPCRPLINNNSNKNESTPTPLPAATADNAIVEQNGMVARRGTYSRPHVSECLPAAVKSPPASSVPKL